MKTELPAGIHRVSNDSETAELWNRFLSGCGDAGFYHRFEWKGIYERNFKHKTYYLASVQSGQIDGILPLVLVSSRIFGRILCSLPFLNFGGPITRCRDGERALMERSYEIARETDSEYLEIRGRNISDESLQCLEHKVSMTIRLESDPETQWQSFKSKHRTNIRRVYKEGITVTSGGLDHLDAFYEILTRSWRNLGTPIYRKTFFADILYSLPDETRIFVAWHAGRPIGAALNGEFAGTVEGMWAGLDPAYRRLQVNYVLYWEMIKDACQRGFRLFHLGRSTADSGGEFFKKKWGAELQPLYWQYYLPAGGPIPGLNVDNPRWALAIKAWRRLPLPMTRILGPSIARGIP